MIRQRNIFRLTVTDGVDSREISIGEIFEDERENKILIGGGAYGLDVGHCVYLGLKYSPGFANRIKWYYINPNEDNRLGELRRKQPSSIRVEFYE